MPATVDAAAPASLPDGSASSPDFSWTHEVSGTDTALLAGIEVDTFTDTGLTSAVSWNGTAMQSLGRVQCAGASHGYLEVFGITGISGTGTIAAVISGGTPGDIAGASISFNGVDQAAPFGTPGTGESTSTDPSAETAGSTVDSIVAGFLAAGNDIASASAPASSQIINNWQGAGGGGDAGNIAAATSPSTGSAVSVGWTISDGSWAALVVEVLAKAEVTGGGSWAYDAVADFVLDLQ